MRRRPQVIPEGEEWRWGPGWMGGRPLRFPVDMSIKQCGYGQFGSPIEGHPRRCQSRNRFGLQCKNWAVPERNFCRYHGGRNARTYRRFRQDLAYDVRHYVKFVEGTLRDRLVAVHDADTVEQRMDLQEEISVARLLAGEMMAVVGAVLAEENKDKVSEETKIHAIAVVRDGIQTVVGIVEKAAKVSALMRDTVSASTIEYVIAQMTKVLERHVDQETAEKICEEFQSMPMPREGKQETRVSISLD